MTGRILQGYLAPYTTLPHQLFFQDTLCYGNVTAHASFFTGQVHLHCRRPSALIKFEGKAAGLRRRKGGLSRTHMRTHSIASSKLSVLCLALILLSARKTEAGRHRPPRGVCADAMYGSEATNTSLSERGPALSRPSKPDCNANRKEARGRLHSVTSEFLTATRNLMKFYYRIIEKQCCTTLGCCC